MVVAFPKILKTLLVSVLTGRKIYILESLSTFLVWVFPSVSLYFAPFNSQAVTGLTVPAHSDNCTSALGESNR